MFCAGMHSCQGSWEAWEPVEQWFSTFLKLRPFNKVSHAMVIPSLKTLSLWLHNCNLATVTRHNVNIYAFWWFCMALRKGHLTLRSRNLQLENHCHRPWMRLQTQELSIFLSSFLVFFLFTSLLPSLTFPYLFFPFLFLIWLYVFTDLLSSASGSRVSNFLKKTQDRTRERLRCKVPSL